MNQDSSNVVFNLQQLNAKVTAYSEKAAHMSTIKKIINCFKIYKADVLKRCLPNLITAVQNIQYTNTATADNTVIPDSHLINVKEALQKEHSSTNAEFNKTKEIHQTPHKVANTPVISNSYLTSVEEALQKEHLPTDQENQKKIARKITVLKLVQAEFKKNKEIDQTACEVDAFFKHKMLCLNQGINVALPFHSYYHCTKEKYFDALIESRKIMQTQALAGFGVYVSTNIEHKDYGPYTLVMEGNTVETLGGIYWNIGAAPDSRPFKSIYVRILSDIPADLSTVSHIAVESLSDRQLMENRLSKLCFPVPVLTRKATYLIEDLFQNITLRQLSEKWKPLIPKLSKLPKNFQQAAA